MIVMTLLDVCATILGDWHDEAGLTDITQKSGSAPHRRNLRPSPTRPPRGVWSRSMAGTGKRPFQPNWEALLECGNPCAKTTIRANSRQEYQLRNYLFMVVVMVIGCCLCSRAEAASLTAAQQQQQLQAVANYNVGDYQDALSLLTQLAALGDAQSEADLGTMYYNGWGVAQDTGRAFALQNKAVAQYDGDAENNLGQMYLDSGDYAKSFVHFSAAAAKNNAAGAYNLALSYENGWGAPADTPAQPWPACTSSPLKATDGRRASWVMMPSKA